jgi:hypothetical protein
MYVPRQRFLQLGCLNSIAVYKLSLARLQKNDVRKEVVDIIGRLERNDPMRIGRYKDWQTVIKASNSSVGT